MSVLGLLFILFVGLKLTGYIDWSWWLVAAPLYPGILIFGGFLLFWISLLVDAIKSKSARRK